MTDFFGLIFFSALIGIPVIITIIWIILRIKEKSEIQSNMTISKEENK